MGDVFNDTPVKQDELLSGVNIQSINGASILTSGDLELGDSDSNLTSKTTASTGIISGGQLTINADPTKFDVSAGKGYVIDHSVTPPTVTIVEWSAFTAQTITNLATSFSTDVVINSAGAIVQQNSFTNTELRSVILLGGLDHSNNTSILRTFEIQVPSEAVGSSLKELSKAIGDINISGNIFSANGANLKINKSSGTAFKFGANNVSTPNDPHTTTQALLTQASFSYVYNDGAGNGVFQALRTDIIATSIDDGTGTLASVTGNNFTIQRILFFPNGNQVFIQYGTQSYNTLASAISALSTQNYTALNGIKTATVRGFLIVRANATTLNSSTQALFVNADRFGGIGARDGGGGVVEWGNITGTVSNQTDLQTVLDGKVNDTGNETIAGEKTFTGKTINTLTAVPSTGETIHEWSVSDSDSVFKIVNRSTVDADFEPEVIGSKPTGTTRPLIITAEATTDTGTNLMMTFIARTIAGASIVTRPIFRWANNATQVMRMLANGNTIIGTATTTILKLKIQGDFGCDITSPTQISSDQNNYATSGFSMLRLSTDASRNITGFTDVEAGKFLYIHNVGSFNIVLNHQNASSTAANRMILGSAAASVTIAPNDSVSLQYDNITARWRLIGKSF